jgi:hypothetical protein
MADRAGCFTPSLPRPFYRFPKTTLLTPTNPTPHPANSSHEFLDSRYSLPLNHLTKFFRPAERLDWYSSRVNQCEL